MANWDKKISILGSSLFYTNRHYKVIILALGHEFWFTRQRKKSTKN